MHVSHNAKILAPLRIGWIELLEIIKCFKTCGIFKAIDFTADLTVTIEQAGITAHGDKPAGNPAFADKGRAS